MTPTDKKTPSGKADGATLVVGLLLAALATVVAWDASRITFNVNYGVGPSAMPYIVATGLAALAIGHFITAFQHRLPARESFDLRAVLTILGGLALLIAIIGFGGGFIPATTALFACTATAFGRRAYVADIAVGLVLGTLVFIGFDRVLSLSLPAGPIERFILSLWL